MNSSNYRVADSFLDRLATSPTALIGAVVASGLWSVAVLVWLL